jgi:putative transposase
MSRYHFIKEYRTSYPVPRLCQVLGVAPSRYYAWLQRQHQVLEPQEPAWEIALNQTFEKHKKRYGTRRLRVALRQQGHRVGRQALRTAMRRHF